MDPQPTQPSSPPSFSDFENTQANLHRIMPSHYGTLRSYEDIQETEEILGLRPQSSPQWICSLNHAPISITPMKSPDQESLLGLKPGPDSFHTIEKQASPDQGSQAIGTSSAPRKILEPKRKICAARIAPKEPKPDEPKVHQHSSVVSPPRTGKFTPQGPGRTTQARVNQARITAISMILSEASGLTTRIFDNDWYLRIHRSIASEPSSPGLSAHIKRGYKRTFTDASPQEFAALSYQAQTPPQVLTELLTQLTKFLRSFGKQKFLSDYQYARTAQELRYIQDILGLFRVPEYPTHALQLEKVETDGLPSSKPPAPLPQEDKD